MSPFRSRLDRAGDRERRVEHRHRERRGERRRPERQAKRHVGVEDIARALRAVSEMCRGQLRVGRHRFGPVAIARRAGRQRRLLRARRDRRGAKPVDRNRDGDVLTAAVRHRKIDRDRLPGHDQAVTRDRVEANVRSEHQCLGKLRLLLSQAEVDFELRRFWKAHRCQRCAHLAKRFQAGRERRDGCALAARRQRLARLGDRRADAIESFAKRRRR